MRYIAGIVLGLGVAVVASAQDASDADAFRKLYSELRAVMDRDLDEAIAFVETAIAEAPDSIDRNILRDSLASRLLERERDADAKEQLRKLLEFQVRRVDDRENQTGLWMTLQGMREAASEKEFADSVHMAYQAIAKVAQNDPVGTLFSMSRLAVMEAQTMAAEGNNDAATQLVQRTVQQLIDVNRSDEASEETAQMLISMLRSLTTDDPVNDLWRKECIESIEACATAALEKYPDSSAIQNEYAETQWRMITRWGQDDPEATEQRMDLVSKKLNPLALRNRSLQAILRRIETHKQRMEDAKPPETLVGKPMPSWDIDAWVNAPDSNPETKQDAFRGKVVLIDFWAMWCGPCIATFPHLREWREEFGDQGFEIVGVTQYYNFVWDDLNQRASQSETPVDADDERETLAKFLEHHQLKHPVFVAPEKSSMTSEYGVRGIPHVILVDREGIVQLIKTGAGEETAKEIHEKIKELVEKDD